MIHMHPNSLADRMHMNIRKQRLMIHMHPNSLADRMHMNIMHLLQRIFRLLPSLRMILGVSNCSRIHSVIIFREM